MSSGISKEHGEVCMRQAANDSWDSMEAYENVALRNALNSERQFRRCFGFHAGKKGRAAVMTLKSLRDLTYSEIRLIHKSDAMQIGRDGNVFIHLSWATLTFNGILLITSLLGLTLYLSLLLFAPIEKANSLLSVLGLVTLFGLLFTESYNRTIRVVQLLNSIKIRLNQRWSLYEHLRHDSLSSDEFYSYLNDIDPPNR